MVLGWVLNQRTSEARALLDEAIALGLRDPSISRTDLATAMSRQAGLLNTAGKDKEAEALYRKALAVGRQEDPDGYWQTIPLHFLGILIARRNIPRPPSSRVRTTRCANETSVWIIPKRQQPDSCGCAALSSPAKPWISPMS